MKLKKEVENLLSEVDSTHRYSMSRIYNIYNQVFGTSEKPQSCASCLIRKVNELRKWYQEQHTVSPPKNKKNK